MGNQDSPRKSTALEQRKATAATVSGMLKKAHAHLEASVARQVDIDRLSRISLSLIMQNAKLAQCTPQSLCSAIMEAGKLGLEPGLFGQAYLVPYKTKCTLIVGYRGLIELMRRTGDVAKVEARIVYDNDTLEIEYGSHERFVHRPLLRGDRGPLFGVYAEVTFMNGHVQREWMNIDDVERIRKRSRAANDGPWVTDYDEMARKTVVRRIAKYVPLSIEAQEAIRVDDERQFGGMIDARNGDSDARNGDESVAKGLLGRISGSDAADDDAVIDVGSRADDDDDAGDDDAGDDSKQIESTLLSAEKWAVDHPIQPWFAWLWDRVLDAVRTSHEHVDALEAMKGHIDLGSIPNVAYGDRAVTDALEAAGADDGIDAAHLDAIVTFTIDDAERQAKLIEPWDGAPVKKLRAHLEFVRSLKNEDRPSALKRTPKDY